MGVAGVDQPLCACYKACQEFHKVVELKDTGLVIYCHTTHREDVVHGGKVGSAINTSQDVFILHNTKDVKITSADFIPDLQKNDISCPRCRQIFGHAQELLQQVKSIDKKNVMGICDRCRKKAQAIKKPCNECEEIVKKFLSAKSDQRGDTKRYIKLWLSKMRLLLKDSIKLDMPDNVKTRAYSELQIDRLCRNSPESRREPEVKEMFYAEKHKSDINLHTEIKYANLKDDLLPKSVLFTQPVEPFDIAQNRGENLNEITSEPFPIESDATFVEPYKPVTETPKTVLKGHQDQISEYYDDSPVDVKEAIKRKHDLNLRKMVRPEIYEIPKIAPWEQQESHTSITRNDTESDVKIRTKSEQVMIRRIQSQDQHSALNRPIKYASSRISPKASVNKKRAAKRKFDLNLKQILGPERQIRNPHSEQYAIEKYEHGKIRKGSYDSVEIPTKVKKREHRYLTDEDLKFQRSLPKYRHEIEKPHQKVIEKTVKRKQSIEAEERAKKMLKKQFSYFFPKSMEKEPKKLGTRSSVLIRNTKEKMRQKAEKEKERQIEERKIKLEEEEQKKLAREERKRLAEEKKTPLEEQNKDAEQKRKTNLENKLISGGNEKDMKEKNRKEKEKNDSTPEFRQKGIISAKETDDTKTESKDELNKEIEGVKQDLKGKLDTNIRKDKEIEEAKRDIKENLDTYLRKDKDTEAVKKDLNEKLVSKGTFNEIVAKEQKVHKAKTTQRDKGSEIWEKAQKDLKSKTERRDNLDEVPEKAKKDLKSYPEFGLRIDESMDKSKKDKGLKSESKDKIEEVEKEKKVLKSKSEKGDKIDEDDKKAKKLLVELKKESNTEGEKEKYSKTGLKDKNKEAQVRKGKDKQEQLQRAQEEERLKQIAQLRKEKESTFKKKDTSQDVEAQSKKISEPTKEKAHSKKTEISSKDKGESPKKVQTDKEKQETPADITKSKKQSHSKEIEEQKKPLASKSLESPKKQRKSKEIEDPKKRQQKEPEASKKQPSSKEAEELIKQLVSKEKKEKEQEKKGQEKMEKEAKELAKKVQVISKEMGELPGKKPGKLKETEEPSKKVYDSILNKEDPSKGKEKKSNLKEGTEKVSVLPKKPKDGMDEAQFRKLQADLAKEKEAEVKKKKQQELEEQKARELADKRAKEGGDGTSKSATKEAKASMKSEPKPTLNEEEYMKSKKNEKFLAKDLKFNQIKIRNTSEDDLILRLVRIKQTATGPWKKPLPSEIDPELVKAHKCHHQCGQMSGYCILCQDSDLELDVESYDNYINNEKSEIAEIIMGEKIVKYKPPLLKPPKEEEVVPILFQSLFREESALLPPAHIEQVIPQDAELGKKTILATLLSTKDNKGVELEPAKGIIRYALSDRTFIDKGWTMLPTEKVVRKMNVYRMRPAHPEFDWFEHNKNKRLMTYDSGEKLAEFDDNGRGRWYYKSGRLALDYYDAEETNAQQRFVIYSSGEPDERGRTHPITILATFDYLGNGIVFDHAGKIRLKYNQTEGVVLDRGIGPVSHWKWHTLNDPPVLQQVMIDTQMAHKDPTICKLGSAADSKARPDNEEMLAIEFDNFIKEKSKKLSQKFKPFQIKMKALKINEHFSLKVLDQATIYLIFRDGSTNLKLNIGMILDHQEIVDTDTAEVGEVSNNLERFPARTDSLAGLQRSVAYAQRYERQRTERERRLRPPEPCASADHLTAAASPPLRPPLRTMPTGSTTSAGYCNCRKPTNNLYYNTRLL